MNENEIRRIVREELRNALADLRDTAYDYAGPNLTATRAGAALADLLNEVIADRTEE